MDGDTLLNVALVLFFVLVGGVFAGTEIALVSLRDSQLTQLERSGSRGARVAAVARDPNRFLAAVQIGVTVAGFFSAAYGGSTLAPDLAPHLESWGLSEDVADATALVLLTLLIAYLSLVLGELVPKRLALQKAAPLAVAVGPPLDRFATLMRPVIGLLSASTNVVVRMLGGDPHATTEDLSDEELRDLVATHEGLGEQERRIMHQVFRASTTTVKEVMRPRGEVVFLEADEPLADAARRVRGLPHSRYPILGEDFDDVIGFLHVRDLLGVEAGPDMLVGAVRREVLMLPASKPVLPAVSTMRQSGTHLAVVVDEYGGTDGIVTLEDLVEELVGEIRDEYDAADVAEPDGSDGCYDGGLTIEDFAERSGVELEDGPYETLAGYVLAQLGRIPVVGDSVPVGDIVLRVAEMQGYRVTRVQVTGSRTEA